LQPRVERFQRALPADGIPEKDYKKVDDFVVSEAPPRKVYTLTDLGQDAMLPQILDDQHDFAKPGGR
jgi:DNA-binding PadR family transcriptional regulator